MPSGSRWTHWTQTAFAYDDTPGVSSFCGAAAALNAEYTLPTVSQTVIITRMEGRTPVPEQEKLTSLAAHGATMVIFLSIGLIDKVQAALLQGAYTPDTPAAVVYKASWPEEKIVRCNVGSLAKSTRAAGITKTALIVVGDFLGTQYERSKLYDPAFTTEFRKGETGMTRAYLAFTETGLALAKHLAAALPGSVARCGQDGVSLGSMDKHSSLCSRMR